MEAPALKRVRDDGPAAGQAGGSTAQSAAPGGKETPAFRGVVRRASIDDLESLVAANVALALETENLALDRDEVQRGVRAVLEDASKGMYWVIEESSTVVAQLMITFEWSDWRNRAVWWIQSVYVLPSCRRQGNYRHLYKYVKAEAQKAGAAGLRLYADSSNLRAQDTYKSLQMRSHYLVFEDLFTPF